MRESVKWSLFAAFLDRVVAVAVCCLASRFIAVRDSSQCSIRRTAQRLAAVTSGSRAMLESSRAMLESGWVDLDAPVYGSTYCPLCGTLTNDTVQQHCTRSLHVTRLERCRGQGNEFWRREGVRVGLARRHSAPPCPRSRASPRFIPPYMGYLEVAF